MSGAAELLAALTPVVEALEKLGVPYQIGGSVASSMYGMARSTMDVDLVADLSAGDVEAFVAALGADYYADADMIRSALAERSCFNLIHQATMLKVDVFAVRDRPYERESLGRRRLERLADADDAREFSVATPEDVILAKLEWYDRGGRSSERQWGDILGVLRVQGDGLDLTYLQRWAPALGLEELLASALGQR